MFMLGFQQEPSSEVTQYDQSYSLPYTQQDSQGSQFPSHVP